MNLVIIPNRGKSASNDFHEVVSEIIQAQQN